MHYPDLGEECQIACGPRVRAVGWLAEGHELTRGEVDAEVVEKLAHLREDGWVHVVACGPHLCELCRNARESRNILVPASDVLYVAPAMIVHYIEEHAYRPPAEFIAAVLACPAPLTDAYFAELRRFLDVFSIGAPMTGEDFDRFAREHRERCVELEAARKAEAARKRFTWD
jgi:hypothetical protein